MQKSLNRDEGGRSPAAADSQGSVPDLELGKHLPSSGDHWAQGTTNA